MIPMIQIHEFREPKRLSGRQTVLFLGTGAIATRTAKLARLLI